jgi:hypothetical protein
VFALEKHLEDFLVKNWANTELGKDYHIFEEDGEVVGQQFPSDTGPIDILATKNRHLFDEGVVGCERRYEQNKKQGDI